MDLIDLLVGWWVIIKVADDEVYEGWMVEKIEGDEEIVIRAEPSQIELSIPLNLILSIDASKERPA